MGIVKSLSANVYRKIAAGEVIERPLSVVKELVENAIDAGAKAIRVELDRGGKERVLVEDDGSGFAADDIEIAFRRHSTSKLSELEDLDRLRSLGFRGEALPSILEVADVDLETADNDQGQGWRCLFRNGVLAERAGFARPRGSRILVRGLFANFPVRGKFLKSDPGELRPVSAYLEAVSLARPDLAFTLLHNGRTVFHYPAAAHLGERIYQVFGKEFLDGLLPLDFSDGTLRLKGFVSGPRGGVSGRNRQFFTVNGRPVRERTLQAAFNNTLQPYLEKSLAPAGVVDLEIPPAQVDVNIHPMKLEIRFQDAQRVYPFVQRALHAALGGRAEQASFLPARGAAGPEASASHVSAGMAQGSAMPVMIFTARTGGGSKYLYAEPAVEGEDFRILGQFHDSYIVAERRGELLLIDQHNARERILFERLQAGLAAGAVPAAQALFPLLLELAPAEAAALDDERMDWFRRAGFDLRRLSGATVEIKAYPELLSEGRVRENLRAALRQPLQEGDAAAREERLLASLACHDAVKVNQRLHPEEMRALVRDLFACANPHFCPHRRPIVVTLTLEAIEKLLKRR